MFQPKHLLIAITFGGLFIPSVSWADNTDDIIKYRKAVYTSMRGHIGAISRIVRAGLGDYKGHITDHATAIQNGIKTPNEVREKEGLEPLPAGDDLMIQGATVPIETQSEGEAVEVS